MKVKKLKQPKENVRERLGIPTRTWLGAAASICYVGLLISLAIWRWSDLAKLELNAIGDFVAGAVGPMAFLWLVLGYLQQGEELQQNTKALELQAKELANTVQQQKELVALGDQQLKEMRLQADKDAIARKAAVRPRFEFNLSEQQRTEYEIRPFSLTIINRGTPCSHLRATASSVRIAESEDLRDSGSQKWHFRISYPYEKPLEDFDIYLGYLDSAGSSDSQTAHVTHYQDEDISTLIIGGEDDIRVWSETIEHMARQRRQLDQ